MQFNAWLHKAIICLKICLKIWREKQVIYNKFKFKKNYLFTKKALQKFFFFLLNGFTGY